MMRFRANANSIRQKGNGDCDGSYNYLSQT